MEAGINGFNDSVDPKELEQTSKTPSTVQDRDGKGSSIRRCQSRIISCLVTCFHERKTRRTRKNGRPDHVIVKEATDMAPDNPRLIWVRGRFLEYSLERGAARKKRSKISAGIRNLFKIKASDDALEPSWANPN